MQAMVLERIGEPLRSRELPTPSPGPGQVQIKVHACGVCRTDLHIFEGDLADPRLPLILGHEIVGTVTEIGPEVEGMSVGRMVGVPWLGRTCGVCAFCRSERENLCDQAAFTGYQIDGGFAEYTLADYRYAFPLPQGYSPVEGAPLLCAGLIGFRALRMAGEAEQVGLYGFGAAAHIIAQVGLYQGREMYAFTKPGDREKQEFARSLGVTWAGGSDELPPRPLDAALIFAPVGSLIPQSLQAVVKGGIVVCAGIHMSPIPSFPYAFLWEERGVKSVANLTRRDASEFLELAPKVPVRATVRPYPLARANDALADLREGKLEGAAVLVMRNGSDVP